MPNNIPTETMNRQATTGVRTYQIILRSGSKIEFRAAWNKAHDNIPGPAEFIEQWEDFKSTGQLPEPNRSGYRFSNSNDSPKDAVLLNVDLRDVVAIVQILPDI